MLLFFYPNITQERKSKVSCSLFSDRAAQREWQEYWRQHPSLPASRQENLTGGAFSFKPAPDRPGSPIKPTIRRQASSLNMASWPINRP